VVVVVVVVMGGEGGGDGGGGGGGGREPLGRTDDRRLTSDHKASETVKNHPAVSRGSGSVVYVSAKVRA